MGKSNATESIDPKRNWWTPIQSSIDGWDRFWFRRRHIDTLAVLRIFTGAMLLYSHVVLALDLSSFLGANAIIDNATSRSLQDGTFGPATAAWSTLWSIQSPAMIQLHHGITIAVTVAMMIGFLTRLTVPLALILQWMLLHRLLGALFGLDQIVTYCAMYLAITPCGAVWSLDAWIRRRRLHRLGLADDETLPSGLMQWLFPPDRATVAANVGTRLLQLHLCAIYLFGGLAKARGQMWWDGTALWYAISNYEYQSFDVTFLASYPRFFTALTHLTLFWEIFYAALVWPRWSRGITVSIAVAVHGGIAMFLGMITFGAMMMAANGIFIDPNTIRRWRLGAERVPVDGDASIGHRIDEVEQAEASIKRRYRKLKSREEKVKVDREKIREIKSKLRDRLSRGELSPRESDDDLLRDD